MTPPRLRVAVLGNAPDDQAERALAAADVAVVAGPLPADCDMVVLHVEALADEAVEAAIADTVAGAGGCPVVVTLLPTQIDAAGAAALDADLHLLCDANAVDWAIALASVRPGLRGAAVREGEAARIARINAEIARIADMLVRLTREEPPALADARPGYDAGGDATIAVTATEIRQLIRARRLRDRMLGEGLFEDPAWDMMLDLLAARLEGAQVSVSSLCIAAAVAPTTALRWITRLTAGGLLERRADPFDRRRALMSLSDRAWRGLCAYVATLKAQGLPLA